jgi:hypothetical protein
VIETAFASAFGWLRRTAELTASAAGHAFTHKIAFARKASFAQKKLGRPHRMDASVAGKKTERI